MKLSATVATILIVLAGVAMMTTSAEATVYEPSSSDARVVAALAAQKRLEQVMLGHDYKAIEGLMAPDLLVNAPINKVANRDNVIGRIKGSQISYEPNVVRNIDYAGVRGDIVVIMGEEIVHPGKDAPYAGKIEHRRFTDIWKEMDGAWKLWIRQATITRADRSRCSYGKTARVIGLGAALRWLIDGFQLRSRISVAIDIFEDLGPLPAQLKHDAWGEFPSQAKNKTCTRQNVGSIKPPSRPEKRNI